MMIPAWAGAGKNGILPRQIKNPETISFFHLPTFVFSFVCELSPKFPPTPALMPLILQTLLILSLSTRNTNRIL